MKPGSRLRSATLCLPFLPLLFVLAAAAPGPKPISSHEKAAREVVNLVGGEELAVSGADMTALLLGDSDLAPYESTLRDWYRKVLADGGFKEEMVKLYMDTFSEKELREIAAFYKTPAGRKTISALPELMQKGVEIGRKQAQAHSEELMEMLEKAREEREKQPAATDGEAQKRTIAQIRNTGTAMFSWLTDQVGAAAAGQSQVETDDRTVDLRQYPPISAEELAKILVPMYLQSVPETDGWGEPYEYFLNVKDVLAPQVMGIRSAGRDGKFSAKDYTVTSFDPDDFDQDIVWADGFFTRWPQR